MQMRVDFVNEQDAGLLSQIRRVAIVLGVADEYMRQPLQDRLCPLAKDLEGNIPIQRPKLREQAVAVCGNTPELDGKAIENFRSDAGYVGEQLAHGRVIALCRACRELDHLLQDRCVTDQ